MTTARGNFEGWSYPVIRQAQKRIRKASRRKLLMYLETAILRERVGELLKVISFCPRARLGHAPTRLLLGLPDSGRPYLKCVELDICVPVRQALDQCCDCILTTTATCQIFPNEFLPVLSDGFQHTQFPHPQLYHRHPTRRQVSLQHPTTPQICVRRAKSDCTQSTVGGSAGFEADFPHTRIYSQFSEVRFSSVALPAIHPRR